MIKKMVSMLVASAMVLSLASCGAAQTGSQAADSTTASGAGTASSTVTVVQPEADITFTFTDDGITASAESDGYKVDGTALTISDAGVYLLTGSCANGSVKVKKGTTDVTLILSDLTLTCEDSAPIVCAKSTGVSIFAAAGTLNTLTDSAKNNDDDFPDNEDAENAVIKCKDGSQVVLEGSGILRIFAKGKNGIKSGCELDGRDASLTIRDLTLDIDAPVNDAVNAEQLLNVESGTLTIYAADDALHCDLVMNVGADGTMGPAITITGCEEGIEAATLNILSGDIAIQANDDCLNAANSDLDDYAFSMNISGGNIVAYTTGGDGFDSNGDLNISGGYVEVWTANTADNQPLDADGTVNITGGTVLAGGGSSGMGMTLVTGQGCVIYGGSNGFGGMGGGFAGGRGEMAGQQPAQMPEQPQGEMPENMERPEGMELPDGMELPENMQMPEQGEAPMTMEQGGDAARMELPQGQQPDQMPALDEENFLFGGFGGAGQQLMSEGTVFTIRDAQGNAVCSGTAPCDTAYLLYCAADVEPEQDYSLEAGSTVVDTQTAASGQVVSSNHFGGGMLGGFAAKLTSWIKNA